MRPATIIYVVCVLAIIPALAQTNVGINTNSPNPHAVLDLVSPNSDQGFLVPRLTTISREYLGQKLTSEENGLVVFDTTEGYFFFWKNDHWETGLGALDVTAAGGELSGFYPNPIIKTGAVTTRKLAEKTVTTEKIADDAITTIKVLDGAITGVKLQDSGVTPGTYGNENIAVQLTVDSKGRVMAIADKFIRIRTENIHDLTILNEDIADQTITISKIDPETNSDVVLVVDSSGEVRWESRSAFISSQLQEDYLLVGDNSNTAVSVPVSGDVTLNYDDEEAVITVNEDAIQGKDIDVDNSDFEVTGTEKVILSNAGGLLVKKGVALAVDGNRTTVGGELDVVNNTRLQNDLNIEGKLYFNDSPVKVDGIIDNLSLSNGSGSKLPAKLATASSIQMLVAKKTMADSLYFEDQLDLDSAFLKDLIDVNTTDIANLESKASSDSLYFEDQLDLDSAFLKDLIDVNATDIANLESKAFSDSLYFEDQLDLDSAFLKDLIDVNATDIANLESKASSDSLYFEDQLDLDSAFLKGVVDNNQTNIAANAGALASASLKAKNDSIATWDKIKSDSLFLKDALDESLEVVAFEVYLSFTSTISSGVVSYNVEEFDEGNRFNLSGHYFSAPKDGFYHFDAQLLSQFQSNEGKGLIIYVDDDPIGSLGGVKVAETRIHGSNGNFITMSVSKTLKLSAGDRVYVRYDGSTRAVDAGREDVYFSGYMIK